MNHFNIALARVQAGLCVLPARLKPKMPTLSTWTQFQERLPEEAELRRWFGRNRPMCIVTGAVSGNLEAIDFDACGEKYDAWAEIVQREMPELLGRLLMERSPSGGRHIVYRCAFAVGQSVKLAQRKVITPNGDKVVLYGKTYQPRKVGDHHEVTLGLIETRGESSIFVCHPTAGYELLQGDYLAVPGVSEAERELMLGAAWSLDELPPAPPAEPVIPGEVSGRPGDDFNERGDVRELLVQHGWRCVRGGDNEYWRRPGKDHGTSATLKNGVFYVFSSNAAPFEPNRGYSKFTAYTLLEHNGDFAAAASALRAQGYGSTEAESSGVDLSAITARLSAAPAKAAMPELIVRWLDQVERETLVWLWPGRIPLGKLTLLAGDPGLGKSFVTVDIAARVSRGFAWPDCSLLEAPTGKVVLFNAEDDLADTIGTRLDLAGADCSKIAAVEGVLRHDPKQGAGVRLYFSLENDLPKLEKLIESLVDVRLVVIDPISAYCGKIDSHNNAEVRSLLAPLADLASRYRIAVVAVTHLSKGAGSKAIYRAMGSLAFTAAARAVWSVVKDANDPKRRLFLPAKLNVAGDPDGLAYRIVEGRVAWESEPVKMHADEAFAAELVALQRGGRSQARQEAMEWLRSKLVQGPQPVAELIEEAKQYGMTEITLRRAFKELGGSANKAAYDGGWQWTLPDREAA